VPCWLRAAACDDISVHASLSGGSTSNLLLLAHSPCILGSESKCFTREVLCWLLLSNTSYCSFSLQTHPFCSRCGKETVPTEGGSRRRCIGRQPHKLYPRTDPVVGGNAQQQQQQQQQQSRSHASFSAICATCVGRQSHKLYPRTDSVNGAMHSSSSSRIHMYSFPAFYATMCRQAASQAARKLWVALRSRSGRSSSTCLSPPFLLVPLSVCMHSGVVLVVQHRFSGGWQCTAAAAGMLCQLHFFTPPSSPSRETHHGMASQFSLHTANTIRLPLTLKTQSTTPFTSAPTLYLRICNPHGFMLVESPDGHLLAKRFSDLECIVLVLYLRCDVLVPFR
jgi:hypothetical protein